jgi:hypothetical protein
MVDEVWCVVLVVRVGGCHNGQLSPVVGEKPGLTSKDELSDLTSHGENGSLKVVFQGGWMRYMHREVQLTIE